MVQTSFILQIWFRFGKIMQFSFHFTDQFGSMPQHKHSNVYFSTFSSHSYMESTGFKLHSKNWLYWLMFLHSFCQYLLVNSGPLALKVHDSLPKWCVLDVFTLLYTQLFRNTVIFRVNILSRVQWPTENGMILNDREGWQVTDVCGCIDTHAYVYIHVLNSKNMEKQTLISSVFSATFEKLMWQK